MLSGVTLFCFAASYSVTLILELTRLFFRAPVRVAVMLGFAAAGWIAHTAFLWYRAQSAYGAFVAGSSHEAPLSNWYDWCLLAAWALAGVYFVLAVRRPQAAVGLFLLPLVLGLVLLAYLFQDSRPFPPQEALFRWSLIHGVALLAGTVAVIMGFAAGLMYLVQSYRLKHKLPPRPGFKLPTLEWLQIANERALLASSGLLAVGLLSGVVHNLIKHARAAAALPWNDPVVWTSGLLIVWLITAPVVALLYKPARQGRKVAYLTVMSFVFLGLVLSGLLLLPSQHGSQAGGSRQSGVGSQDPGDGEQAVSVVDERMEVRGQRLEVREIGSRFRAERLNRKVGDHSRRTDTPVRRRAVPCDDRRCYEWKSTMRLSPSASAKAAANGARRTAADGQECPSYKRLCDSAANVCRSALDAVFLTPDSCRLTPDRSTLPSFAAMRHDRDLPPQRGRS